MFIMCITIFFARLLDVSIGTVRTILMVRGKRKITALLAFVEVIIWFLIAREALNNAADSIWVTISYAGGFAVGTYVGSFITDKFVNAFIGVQVTTYKDNDNLINDLRKEGYGVSVVNLKKEMQEEKKDMLFIELKSKGLSELIKIIKDNDKHAFIVVNERKYVRNGVFK